MTKDEWKEWLEGLDSENDFLHISVLSEALSRRDRQDDLHYAVVAALEECDDMSCDVSTTAEKIILAIDEWLK